MSAMSSDDIELKTRAEPIAAPAPDTRFEPVSRIQVGGATSVRPRFTRRRLLVAFVLFNLLAWAALVWLLMR